MGTAVLEWISEHRSLVIGASIVLVLGLLLIRALTYDPITQSSLFGF